MHSGAIREVTSMTKAREWSNNQRFVRDTAFDMVLDASRDLSRFIRQSRSSDPILLEAQLHLERAQKVLITAGAPARPEQFNY